MFHCLLINGNLSCDRNLILDDNCCGKNKFLTKFVSKGLPALDLKSLFCGKVQNRQ